MYYCKLLDRNQITHIYNTRMQEDFPSNEIKPLASITRALDAGHYACFALFDGEELLGYAFFYNMTHKGLKVMLLDYLAVDKAHRGEGIGSAFFKLMSNYLSAADLTLIESENPDRAETDEEYNIRTKRMDFYLKNGCTDTGISSYVFGAEYKILHIFARREFSNAETEEFYKEIYRSMLAPKFYNDNFFKLH